MFILKKIIFLLSLLLALRAPFTFSTNLTVHNEHTIFNIQTYPSDLQCIIFENMLSHLNTYQTSFFEDEQKKDTEEIQKIGVLRYQIACFMIEHLLKNSIKPKKIPNAIAVIQDILYRGILFIPYNKMIKMNESQLLKQALTYQPIMQHIDTINVNTIPIFSDIFLQSMQALFTHVNNKNFYYPGRPNMAMMLKKELQRGFQKNSLPLHEPIRRASNQIIIIPTTCEHLTFIAAASSILVIIYLGINLFGSGVFI